MTIEGHAAAMSAPIVRTAYHACTANACQQGRKACPCPSACELPVSMEDEGDGLFASRWFWGSAIAIGLALGVTALRWW